MRVVSEERLKIGVIGTGYGAEVHVPGLNHLPGVEVAAICAKHLDHALRVATRYRIPEHFDDYREMLSRCELDAVTIAVPPEHQHPIAIACTEHGRHMLCEKPMGSSAAEARDMHRLVEDAKLCHAVNFQSRFVASQRQFKELVDKGYIGDLESVSVIGYRAALDLERPRRPGSADDGERSAGLLNAIGSEYVDMLRWCFGEFEGVSGMVTKSPNRRSGTGTESSFSILLRFASGASGSVHISGNAAMSLGEEVIASGKDGLLVLQPDGKLFGRRRAFHRVEEIEVPQYDKGDLAAFSNPRMIPFVVLADEWVTQIRTGEPAKSLPSFYDGMKVQDILHGVQRSERLSRWIDVSDKKWPIQTQRGSGV